MSFLSICALLILPIFVSSQSLVLAGGNLKDDNVIVYGKMVELAGGPGAKIGIITAGSANPQAEADRMLALLTNVYGANATIISITTTSNNCNDPDIVDLVRQQTGGIYMAGGERWKLIDTLKPNGTDTLVMAAIRDLIRNGGMLGGPSAGASAQATKVVLLNGETYPALTSGYTYNPLGGLATFPPASPYQIESHCSEKGREGRLIRCLYDTQSIPITGVTKGLCIDENHALVVTDLYGSNPLGTVIGTTGGVHIFDVTNMISNPSPTVDFQGALTSTLTPDDNINLITGEVKIASWKSLMTPGTETYPNAIPSNDIFSSSTPAEMRNAKLRLINNKNDDSVINYSIQTNPQFEMTLNRKTSTVYVGTNTNGDQVFSFFNITVDLRQT